MKRGREDGHLSKEEYEAASSETYPGSFIRADASALSTRRMTQLKSSSKSEELAKHIRSLNRSFLQWFRDTISSDASALCIDGAQDYIDYMNALEDRYCRRYGEVLTFGTGDCGQLAHGIEEDEDLMVRYPRIVYSLRNKRVLGISCGGLHNAVYTQEGRVYTWGCADDGSLGRPGEESEPLLVQGDICSETIIRVACGDGQTIAVSTAGVVWGWGCYKDKEGQKWFHGSSVSDINKQCNEPMRLQGVASRAIDVACGSSFCVAACEDGAIYSWGLGECGELSRGEKPLKVNGKYDKEGIMSFHLTPGKMFIDDNGLKKEAKFAKTIGCGAYHTLIGIGGSVYSCGLNNYGQLGHNDTTQRNFLTRVQALEELGIVSVRGGTHHSLVLSSFGDVLSFGRADSGQLGIAKMANSRAGDFCTAPEAVEFKGLKPDEKIVSIACGSNHNLAVSSAQSVYSWGYGDMSALGHGKDGDEMLPKKLNFKDTKTGGVLTRIIQADGGGQHSAIIAEIQTTK